MADEFYGGEFSESAEGHDPGVPFVVVSAGLLVLGGLALLARSGADKPARRRRSFGLFAILASVALYLLRPKPALVESTMGAPTPESPEPVAPEAEVSTPEEPEPEPDELLPAAQAEVEVEDETVLEPSGWHVIAEAREQSRARADGDRPFVLLQSDDTEQPEELGEETEVAHAEIDQREPVEGVVNRVGLYSRRPEDALEPAEAESF